MARGLFVLVVAVVAFVVYALVDCLVADRFRFKVFNRFVWAVLIIVLPVVGAVLWFTLGRRRKAGRRLIAPDDVPEFLGTSTRPRSQSATTFDPADIDERIRRLEEELGRRDDDGPRGSTPGPASTK